MGHGIVQLAGDPPLLVGDSRPGARLALGPRPIGALSALASRGR